MHCISRESRAESSRQNLRLGFIFARSKFCLRRSVPSFPRLSKSKRRMTSDAPVCSISHRASVKDLPPVLTVKTGPVTPKLQSASTSFFPSTMMRVPFADSSASASRI